MAISDVRQTHTYVTLEVPRHMHAFVYAKLKEAGYDQAFIADPHKQRTVIDMHGIALVEQGGIEAYHAIITQREKEVMVLAVAGKTTKEIAAILFIKFKTAANHLQHLYKKLDVHDRAELVMAAFSAGLAVCDRDITIHVK